MSKVCLANIVGPDGCWLIATIAMIEDAKRYTDDVSFYNEQLLPIVGVGSVDALARLRDKVIRSGWLIYTPGGRGRPGRYRVSVPERFECLPDGALGEDNSDNHLIIRESAEVTAEQTAEVTADVPRKCGGNSGDNRGQTAVNVRNSPPMPFPNTSAESSETTSAEKVTPRPTRKRKATKRAAPPDSNHQPAVGYFCERYAAARGNKYPFDAGKDGAHVKDILGHCDRDLDRFKAIVDVYLATTDDRVANDSGHSLGALRASLPKWIARARKDAPPPTAPAPYVEPTDAPPAAYVTRSAQKGNGAA